MPNVLYITYDGLTDPLGRSQVLPYLERLSRQGFHFTILSFEKKVRMQQEGAAVKVLTDQAGMEWVPLSFTSRPPIMAKAWDRWRMRSKAFALHRLRRFQLVHCRSYVAAEVGLALRQKTGVPYVFDMRGFWADEKVDNGQWNQQHLLYRILYRFYKQKERTLLTHADAVITLTQVAKTYLQQQPNYEQLPIWVIPCCADLEHFNYEMVSKETMQEIRQQLGLAPHLKVLVYLGSIGGWYMTKEMFRFFFLLHQQHPQYRMLVLTKDDPGAVMAEAALQGCSPESLLVRYATREEVPAYLSVCSCSLFFIRNSFSKMASSPTKHAELMGMGLPVICNDIGDTGTIIRNTGTGFIVMNPDAVAQPMITELLCLTTALDKAKIRLAAVENFDLETGSSRYLEVYQKLLNATATKEVNN